MELAAAAAQEPGEAGLLQLFEASVDCGLLGLEFGGHLGLADADGAAVGALEGRKHVEYAAGGRWSGGAGGQ
ncbi:MULTISPECIES: hypothetical protein [unclassified Streptomyces]|uniref:hypothetical protein n=1 Tax=unclassified Streptomyces TaxID=2593676 RepID=UPI0038265881